MATDTKIQWTDYTFNPWRGCTKVHAGCAHCYAETLSKRNPKTLGVWGDNGVRVIAAESYWREPVKWNAAAEKAGERRRVFCASLADVFEDWQGDIVNTKGEPVGRTLAEPRRRLFDLVCRTPWLDWQVLTKRPENALRIMVEAGLYAVENPHLPCPQPNLWIGTSPCDQATADKYIPLLLKVPAAVRFLSCEPLIGPVNLMRVGPEEWDVVHGWKPHAGPEGANTDRVDWVIVGGESGGAKSRPCHMQWARDIVAQCKRAELPVFVKQLGRNVRVGYATTIYLRDPKGGDDSEFPSDLRVRQFPTPKGAAV